MSKKPTVAFLGPLASYSHQATLDCFPDNQYDLIPQTTIRDVFEAVSSDAVDHGVVPFENSSNGSVVHTFDLFADRDKKYGAISVAGETFLDVHHCLLGHKSADAPGGPGIQRIYSHPQALGQCDIFLSAHHKASERQEVSSTSKAAEIVAADRSGTLAAIAGRTAAKVYGLDILAENIEDRSDNTTRFLIIQKTSGGKPCANTLSTISETGKCLVAFTVDHRLPGALADALMVFKTHKLNLTSINSRPSRERLWHYIFFVEFQQSKTQEEEGVVQKAFRELDKFVESCRLWGCWKQSSDDSKA